MRTIKRRVGSLVLKIEKNGLQILVQREILHKYSHLQVLFDKKSLFGSYPTNMPKNSFFLYILGVFRPIFWRGSGIILTVGQGQDFFQAPSGEEHKFFDVDD